MKRNLDWWMPFLAMIPGAWGGYLIIEAYGGPEHVPLRVQAMLVGVAAITVVLVIRLAGREHRRD